MRKAICISLSACFLLAVGCDNSGVGLKEIASFLSYTNGDVVKAFSDLQAAASSLGLI